MKIYTVAIIGGGAAGLLCALRLQERKVGGVVLFERNDRLGRKLSATGNGQGNISNLALSEENYFSSDAAAAFALIRRFGRDELLRYLTSLGGLFSADERGRVYPESRQASSVTDLLRFSLRRGNTEIRLGEYVSEVRKTGELFTICTEKGTYVTEKVVLACGGMAAPHFGSDGNGQTQHFLIVFANRRSRQIFSVQSLFTNKNFEIKRTAVRTFPCRLFPVCRVQARQFITDVQRKNGFRLPFIANLLNFIHHFSFGVYDTGRPAFG